jgi:hypothetical protein
MITATLRAYAGCAFSVHVRSKMTSPSLRVSDARVTTVLAYALSGLGLI